MIITGNVYVSDRGNNRVRKITASTSVITTIAGTGSLGYSGDGGQATSASVQEPQGLNLDSAGNIYVGDYNSYSVVRKITVSTGIINTVAGTGSMGYNGDNIQATAASLNNPNDVMVDSYGNLYICDRSNHRVRKVDVSTGLITTLVGNGAASSTGDGSAATSATVNSPYYSRFDNVGNLYITEASRIRNVITVTTDIPTVIPTIYPTLSPHSISIITTIAGTGTGSYSGDGGQATSAAINGPVGIIIDSGGNVYFNDYYNHRVRKISTSTGIISTYAGTGTSGYSGDGGAAINAALNCPDGLCIDTAGMININSITVVYIYNIHHLDNLYIADFSNCRIRKVTASTSVVSTIAGTGVTGYSGDKVVASSASLYGPVGVAVDTSGKNTL